MKNPPRPTLPVFHTGRGLLALLALSAMVREGSVQGQQVPEIRNTEAAFATAPMLVLAEEARFVPETRSGGDVLPGSYLVRVDGKGWVYLMDAPKAVFRYVDDGTRQVWVFDPEGRFRRSIGAGGALFNPTNFAVARDSVIVYDFAPRRGGPPGHRRHILAADGRLLETHDYPDRVSPPFGIHGTDMGWVAAERLRIKTPRGERHGPYRDSTLVLSFLPAPGETRTVLSYPSAPQYLSERGWISSPVLSSHPRYAVGRDGRIYSHPGDRYIIEVRNHDGTPEKRILGEVDLIEVTEEDFEEGIRRAVRSLGIKGSNTAPDSERDALERNARWAGMADHRPVLGRMWASGDGSILVERLDLAPDAFASADPTEWDVIGPDGRVAGRLSTPLDLMVQAFEWPHVYATRLISGRSEAVRFRITGR